MDVFQNSIGRLAGLRVPQLTGLQLAGIGMCSSLAVWNRTSVDGRLRHARNFDFPGIGVWDARPAVVFCSPTDGLNYGFVTSLGVDLPGITGFNEAGITLTAHTRMHAHIDPDGTCIADLGHEVVRRARTLGEAVDIVRQLGSSSTWGLLVSSAAERDAVLIETTGQAVRTVEPGAAHHLACTNRYRHRALQRDEVRTSDSFAIDSDARFETLESAARRGGLTAEDLQSLLATAQDPGAQDTDLADRITGSCITSPLTVQSVVVEPESAQIRVAAGRAPVARGPWEVIPWQWGDAVGVRDIRNVVLPIPDSPLDRARAAYVEAARIDLEGAPASQVHAHLHAAADHAPREPHLQLLGALASVAEGSLETASDRLRRGLEVESVPYRRAQLHRWAARVAEAQQRMRDAHDHRAHIRALGPAAGPVLDQLQSDLRRPATRRSLARTVPDLLLIDA
ncbi:MAG TPA: hypothetical protein DFR83_09530 [Deltaproteobacteria bacterium]|nr:hypothetical protein [Deltaproteobacteria bacterium]